MGRGLHYSSLSREGRSPAFLMVCSRMRTLQSRLARLTLVRRHCTQEMGCRQGGSVYGCLVRFMLDCMAVSWAVINTVRHVPFTARNYSILAASAYSWHVRAKWVEQHRLVWSTFPVLQTPAAMSIAACMSSTQTQQVGSLPVTSTDTQVAVEAGGHQQCPTACS